MDILDQLLVDVRFRISIIDAPALLDIGLVAITFFLLLQLIRRSQAAVLLRGVLISLSILLVSNLVLPLPTFDWVILGLVIALLIATPITLQPELRRWLENLGQQTLFGRNRVSLVEEISAPLRHALLRMSETRTGALLVIEGKNRLDEIAETGIRVDGNITDELLRTLFFDKTPLHDGAVLIRNAEIIAASCVLPLTKRELVSYRRLGTRHRAAVGISELSDALTLVVSEETGVISRALRGELITGLDESAIRREIFSFFTERGSNGQLNGKQPGTVRRYLEQFAYLLFAIVLSLLAWGVVVEQINPTQLETVTNIPLRVTDLPANVQVLRPPPSSVAVDVRTFAEVADRLNANNFQAVASLDGLEPGIHSVPVNVTSSAEPLQYIAIDPATISVEIAPIVSRTLPINVAIEGEGELPIAYTLGSLRTTDPSTATIVGPAPLVNAVVQLQAPVSVAGATAAIRRSTALQAVDDRGNAVPGISIQPQQVQVRVSVQPRFDAREVGVRVTTSNTPPEGYWLSNLTYRPSSVTLRGSRQAIEAFSGNFVTTEAIVLDNIFGTVTRTLLLDMPADLEALDSNGETIEAITAIVEVSALQGNLLVTRELLVLNDNEQVTVTLESDTVDILLSGPLPVLREIEQQPGLVNVTLDAARIQRNVAIAVTPDIVLPSNVRFQLINAPILVTIED